MVKRKRIRALKLLGLFLEQFGADDDLLVIQ